MAVNKLDITMMEDVGTSASQLLQRDGSGNIPAVDGSQITGITEFTTSTSDPVVTTNPSGGVGSLWYNKTGGEMFVCTDATAGANVWKNVGAGSGDIVPYVFQGTADGYAVGGADGGTGNSIHKFSLTTDGDSTDVADLTVGRSDNPCGQKSKTHGYCSGGYNYPGSALKDAIDKWSFVTTANATDVGNLTDAKSQIAGQSSEDYGYTAGGSPTNNVIERFSFSSDGNSVDRADLTTTRQYLSGHNSATHGYVSGGAGPLNIIEKFPFASATNASDVGDLTNTIASHSNQSSTTNGYASGGASINVINKFSFSSDGNATDAGDLTVARSNMCGVTSTTHGYACGGDGWIDVIDKFTTASDANATDVGNMAVVIGSNAGTQY